MMQVKCGLCAALLAAVGALEHGGGQAANEDFGDVTPSTEVRVEAFDESSANATQSSALEAHAEQTARLFVPSGVAGHSGVPGFSGVAGHLARDYGVWKGRISI